MVPRVKNNNNNLHCHEVNCLLPIPYNVKYVHRYTFYFVLLAVFIVGLLLSQWRINVNIITVTFL